MDQPAGTDRPLRRLLDAAEDASPVQAVEAVTRELGRALGATSVSFLIADLSGRALVRLAQVAFADAPAADIRHDDKERATVLPFDGGPAEQALQSQQVQVVPPDLGPTWTVLAPITERGEALGLLELDVLQAPSQAVVDEVRRTAHVLGYVIIASRRHTDLYEWGQRSTPFSLSAEIQRRLLPAAYTCEAGSFTLAAWLEPAGTIAGDTFDYSLGRDHLHLSVTDAVGHGVASALTATLCVGSLRNTRRLGETLLEQAATTNTALLENGFGVEGEGFATALLGRLDLRTGHLDVVNAGHAAPYLARDGQVDALDLPADLPLGLFVESAYRSTTVPLLAGDRLVAVTDGMLERAAASLDLEAHIQHTRELHPREATRALADLVLEASGGVLADDAALLVLDWHGDHGTPRRTVAGADSGPTRVQARDASSPTGR
ncbi:MAG: serine/threonine-protein phosphatase [Actinomycetota bacterium]|nr:serine/threonine-protein phosphatase [Actinomycetota bacterium]